MSHVYGCSVATPQVLQGWWQDPDCLVSGQAVIAKHSRGVSPQLQHTANSPPTAHWHWNGQDREKGNARDALQHREQGVPIVPMTLPKGQSTPWSHGSCSTWISSGKRAPKRSGSPGLSTLACAVPALATLSCLTPLHWHCSHNHS